MDIVGGGIVVRLEQLDYLLAIERYHSMNKASDAIFVSQQSISAAIRQLEEEFGTSLVIRTNRGSFLTEAGQELCRAAQTFYAQCDLVKERFGAKRPPTAKLDLIIEQSLQDIWANVFTYYLTHYPHIELERTMVDYIDLEKALEDSPESIVISYLDEGFWQKFEKKYYCHIVETVYISLLLPKQSALAQSKNLSLKSLHGMNILFFAPKGKQTALSLLLEKYDLEAQGNKYIYQVTHRIINELSKNDNVVCFAPNVLANTAYESMVPVALKEKLSLYLCAISKERDVPPELIQALKN